MEDFIFDQNNVKQRIHILLNNNLHTMHVIIIARPKRIIKLFGLSNLFGKMLFIVKLE